MLNQPSSINDDAIDKLPQLEFNGLVDEKVKVGHDQLNGAIKMKFTLQNPRWEIDNQVLILRKPTVMETRKAFQNSHPAKLQLQMQFLPRSIRLGVPLAEKLAGLFHCMWRKEAIPQELEDASIIHIYKRKGNPQVCDNH